MLVDIDRVVNSENLRCNDLTVTVQTAEIEVVRCNDQLHQKKTADEKMKQSNKNKF